MTMSEQEAGACSGVDNSLFSDLTFSNCALAYHQRAPDSNRNAKGQCLQAFDSPSMGYMDKTVFWRNRVIGGGGVRLEPCRADCLNMWIECEFDSAEAGITLVDGRGDW
eukprot:SAG22_NODE_200_length_15420_cov_4.424581_10_plen_109_part_00